MKVQEESERLNWCDTKSMLSDCLTKSCSASQLSIMGNLLQERWFQKLAQKPKNKNAFFVTFGDEADVDQIALYLRVG